MMMMMMIQIEVKINIRILMILERKDNFLFPLITQSTNTDNIQCAGNMIAAVILGEVWV